ncbi:MAG: DUF4157 domain-containing protein [Alphaproteobacteria bacterium]|nr:DUF4157 domain-containing protein [Alphaproteobacteria bacterium]
MFVPKVGASRDKAAMRAAPVARPVPAAHHDGGKTRHDELGGSAAGGSAAGAPSDFARVPVSTARYEREADEVASHVLSGRSFDHEYKRVSAAPQRPSPRDEPLPARMRQITEPLLGRDFSSVRLREASDTDRAASPPDTHAFTRGKTITLFPGRYQPDLPLGQALIAHELTHVAQQCAAPALPSRRASRRTFARGIEEYRDGRSAEGSARDALVDDTGLYPLSRAPLGMQQRCVGCSSCNDTDKSTAASSGSAAATVAPAAPSAGTTARASAKTLVDQRDASKNARDKVKSALVEIRQGKALDYHKTKTPDAIKAGAKALGIPEAGLLTDWTWFLDNGPPSAKPRADDAAWKSRQDAFMGKIQSPLDKLEASHSKSQATNFLKNTPANVFDVIIQVATAAVPPAFLYAVAGREGLVDQYIRGQVASPAQDDRLSESEMAGVRVDKKVSGFGELGLDDFFTELGATRQPLKNFFPSGFTEKNVTESTNTNEKGRTVRSADAPDLKTALQGLVAVLSRRKALFLEDVATHGYPAPTGDQTVYFTYVYYNTGPGDPKLGDGTSKDNGGYQTLSRHRPAHPTVSERRGLQDWITKGEYSNAIHVLQTYQVIVASGVLKGL